MTEAGQPAGSPDNSRSTTLAQAGQQAVEQPFRTAFVATLGAFGALLVFRALRIAGPALILIGLSFFLAVGLDPVVRFLGRRGLRRSLATALVLITLIGAIGGFLAAAIPPLLTEAKRFTTQLPHYTAQIQAHQGTLGHLDQRYHLLDTARRTVHSGTASGPGLIDAGMTAIGAVTGTIVVLVLTAYFLGDLPRITRGMLRLVPSQRRERVESLAEKVFNRIGGYVLGNAASSAIAGLGTFIWLEIFRVPFATLLGVFVAIIDLVPVAGSTVGGIIVSLISLTVSLPVAIATAFFYVAYRLLEDYLITPRIMGSAVDVPPLVTVLAVLTGGALAGVLGALVAIPTAAALRIVLTEVAYPRLDKA